MSVDEAVALVEEGESDFYAGLITRILCNLIGSMFGNERIAQVVISAYKRQQADNEG